MFRGLWKLTWVELKVFMREPMGAVSTLALPAVLFLVLGKAFMSTSSETLDLQDWVGTGLPVMLTILVALNGVVSLTTIMSIYREGGILKRLKATPLQPHTILTAHVIVKLLLTTINILTLLLVGKTFFDVTMMGDPISFAIAVAVSTISILSLGFVIASVVPTARFAQLISGAILYPLLGVSGIFTSVENFPPILRFFSNLSPITHAVSLTGGMWAGESWSNFGVELFALAAAFIVCMLVSSRLFRWE